MLTALINQDGSVQKMVSWKEFQDLGSPRDAAENRNDWETFQRAEEVAAQANAAEEVAGLPARYVPVDNGPWCSPRYDVVRAFRVGEEVSYGFNGDSYPCGTVSAISASGRVIRTTEGGVFYRRRLTASWVANQTWSLMHGVHSTRNPEF